MGYVREKVAYVKGLADGLSLSDASKEGRVLSAVLEVLEELADSVEENEAALADMNECIERLIDDNEALNDIMFGDDDCSFECPHCGETVDLDPDELDGDDDVLCPHCNKPVVQGFDDED